ncbi:MAG: hypothetical protein ACJ72E_08770 [Marmoricola sp.]
MKFRLYAVLVAAVAATGLSVAPAQAATTDPVTDLQLNQVQVGQQDQVSASWTPNDSATAYRMYITDNSNGDPDLQLPLSTDNTTGHSASITTASLAGGSPYYLVVRAIQPDLGTMTILPFGALSLDTVKPVGSFSLNRTSGYLAIDFGATIREAASFTITQHSLSDDSGGTVTRTVTPGDGSATKSWTSGNFILTYTRAGSFTPVVHAKDPYGNVADISLPTITVKADRVAPVVRITRPASTKVAAWRRIHGTATDVGSGIDETAAFVVQKRGSLWYAYDFHKRKWLKGYSTLGKTMRKSKAVPAQMHVTAAHTWQTPLIRGLRTGKLHVEAVALDKDFNLAKAPNVNVVLH